MEISNPVPLKAYGATSVSDVLLLLFNKIVIVIEKVREAVCQGACHGASCCRAKKTKKKKVGMICDDGTRSVLANYLFLSAPYLHL